MTVFRQHQRKADERHPHHESRDHGKPGHWLAADEMSQHQRAKYEIGQVPDRLAELRTLVSLQS